MEPRGERGEDDGEGRGARQPGGSGRSRRHARQGFRARTRSDIPKDGSASSSALRSGMSQRNAPSCWRGRTRRRRTREFSHQPRDARPVQVADLLDGEPGLGHEPLEAGLFVPAVVPQRLVERAVERRERGDEEREVPAGGQDAGEVAQRPRVVLDVLEDVQADDRVDALGGEVADVRVREREAERGDADVRAALELRLQLADVVRLDVGGDDALLVREEAGLVPDAGADLEDAVPEPRPRSGRAATCCRRRALPCGGA